MLGLLILSQAAFSTELAEFDDLESLTAEIVARQPIEEGSEDEVLHHLDRLSDTFNDAVDLLLEDSDFSGHSEVLSRAMAEEGARMLAASNIAGAYDRFRAAARMAADGSQSDELFLRAAAAAIELGENREALEIAARIEDETENERVRERASVLGIRALAFERSRDDALERIQRLDPASALGLYQWYLLDPESEARTSLEQEYEDSLPTMLLEGEVSRILLPSALLSSLSGPSDSATMTGEAETSGRTGEDGGGERERTGDAAAELDERVAGLQLGSYRTEDYAYRHRDRLEEYGWDAEVVEDGDETHKVILEFSERRDREYAEEQLLRLKEDGFEGFVIRSFE